MTQHADYVVDMPKRNLPKPLAAEHRQWQVRIKTKLQIIAERVAARRSRDLGSDPKNVGYQTRFAEALTEIGCPIDKSTVSRWLNMDNTAVPDIRMLWGISQLRKDIDIRWLLGLRDAKTSFEQFIEDEIGK